MSKQYKIIRLKAGDLIPKDATLHMDSLELDYDQQYIEFSSKRTLFFTTTKYRTVTPEVRVFYYRCEVTE